jgi:hypothetical protein
MQPGAKRMILYARAISALRNYAAAAWLNVALVSTMLTPSERARPPHVRVTTIHDARERETVRLADGTTGIISTRYEAGHTGWSSLSN